MVDEVLDRRAQLEQRLARATRLEQGLRESYENLRFDGLTLDQIDQGGVLQQSVKALVMHVSQQVPELDVVLYRGPHSPWGLRVVVTGDDLQVLPVQVGSPAVTGGEEPADTAGLDFSRAAELAAQMWQDR